MTPLWRVPSFPLPAGAGRSASHTEHFVKIDRLLWILKEDFLVFVLFKSCASQYSVYSETFWYTLQEFPTPNRAYTARKPYSIDAVRDSVNVSPEILLRRCAQEIGVSQTSVPPVQEKTCISNLKKFKRTITGRKWPWSSLCKKNKDVTMDVKEKPEK